MQRSYLSLSLSRAWGMDHPVGDPFGGPAYGERAMPVVAVIAAGIGVATGVGMLAAGTAILGSTMLGTIVAGAMIAGGALTIVGTVTGNQKLTKIGNTLSLVGGLSAAAASMTGTMTSTVGMSSSQIAAGQAGTKISLGEAAKIGVDKIATGFDSMVNSTFGANTTSLGTDTSKWLGTNTTLGDVTLRNAPAEAAGSVLERATAAGAAVPNTGQPAPAGTTPAVVDGKAVHITPKALDATHTAAAAGVGPTAPAAPWTTGEKMMTASMAMQGAGAIMTSQAQKEAAALANEKEDARQARINSVVRVATTKAEFDAYNAQGVAAVYLPPTTPTLQAPSVQAPSVRPPTWDMATVQPRQPVVAAVRDVQSRVMTAPTFQVKV